MARIAAVRATIFSLAVLVLTSGPIRAASQTRREPHIVLRVVNEAQKLGQSAAEQIAASRRSFETIEAHNKAMRVSIAESRALLARVKKRAPF